MFFNECFARLPHIIRFITHAYADNSGNTILTQIIYYIVVNLRFD